VETWKVILIIAIVFGVVWSNIALLKYSAKFEMKRLNQDPIEKAKASLKEKESTENNDNKDNTEEKTKNPHQ
jgi:MFS superfamily sulfate permease-like transporter